MKSKKGTALGSSALIPDMPMTGCIIKIINHTNREKMMANSCFADGTSAADGECHAVDHTITLIQFDFDLASEITVDSFKDIVQTIHEVVEIYEIQSGTFEVLIRSITPVQVSTIQRRSGFLRCKTIDYLTVVR